MEPKGVNVLETSGMSGKLKCDRHLAPWEPETIRWGGEWNLCAM